MKRILRFTVIITLAAACALAAAFSSCVKKESYTQGLRYEFDERTGGYMVADIGSAYSSQIVIPSQYEGKPVTSIGVEAFAHCDFITGVVIPDSVVSIGNLAFYGTGLYKDVSKWENDALYIGKHLISVNEYKKGNFTVREGTVNIADCAFYECKELSGIILPDSVKSIGRYAFYGCEKIESFAVPERVTRIDNYAFQNCFSVKEMEIPDGVTYLGNGAFRRCTSLEKCVIGSGIAEIGDDMFNSCKALTQVVIPENAAKIGDNAFNNCVALASITIPHGVAFIGTQAFYYCTSLSEAIFVNKSGWAVSRSSGFAEKTDISSAELSSPATAASYLKSNYNGYFWKRV